MSVPAPYRGLAPFTESEEDAARFFGRDHEVRIITANLVASRLTVLYGPAGVGKSSLLRAGVMHRLRREIPGAAPVAVAYVGKWEHDPADTILEAVAGEVARLGGAVDPPPPGLPLDEALAEWDARLPGRLLIVLDQFEEYCLYHPPDEHPLDRELPRAIERRSLDLRFLIGLREDSLAALDRYKGRVTELFGNRVRLDNLSRASARDAIRCPIERYNESAAAPVMLEDGLDEAVLDEIAPGRVALATQGRGTAHGRGSGAGTAGRVETPYLQLLMSALWDREAAAGSTVLRVDTLRQMGGATAVVRAHVDGVIGRLSPADQNVAADALHFLITPSGTKVAHTVGDLAEYADVDAARLEGVLGRLSRGDARLVRRVTPAADSDAARYEVFHDVLGPAILDWRARLQARRLQRRLATLLGLSVALLVALAGIIAYTAGPDWLHRLEERTVDARSELGGPPIGRDDLVIVDWDKATIAALPSRKWPAPRTVHARLIDELREAGPRVIVYDIDFTAEGLAADTRALQAAIRRARGRIVLAAFYFDRDDELSLFGLGKRHGAASRVLDRLGVQAAFSGFPLDDDKLYRTMQSDVRYSPSSPRVPTLAAVGARMAGIDVPSDERAQPIEFRDGPGSLPSVPAGDVLRGRVAPDELRDKVVIVGASHPAGKDIRPTPVGRMAGPEIQANAFLTFIRDREPLRDVLLIAALALLPALLARTRPLLAALGILTAGIGYLVAAQLLFGSAVILPVVVPLAALVLSALGLLAVRIGLRRRRSAAAPRRPGAGAPVAASVERTEALRPLGVP